MAIRVRFDKKKGTVPLQQDDAERCDAPNRFKERLHHRFLV